MFDGIAEHEVVERDVAERLFFFFFFFFFFFTKLIIFLFFSF